MARTAAARHCDGKDRPPHPNGGGEADSDQHSRSEVDPGDDEPTSHRVGEAGEVRELAVPARLRGWGVDGEASIT